MVEIVLEGNALLFGCVNLNVLLIYITKGRVWTYHDSMGAKFNETMRFFSWVFYSGKAQASFLTYKDNGSISTSTEAYGLVKKYGRFYDSGKLIEIVVPQNSIKLSAQNK